MLLLESCGWFLIELLIFDFSSNFTATDLQKFSFFELLQKMLVMHQKSSLSSKDLINMVSVSLEVLWIVPDRISVFVKFHSSGSAIIFSFWTLKKHVSYASKKTPNQAKELINIVCVTAEGLLIVSDRIVDFRFFYKFHSSGPAKIFIFWTMTENVSYASKKILIKQRSNQHGECFFGRIMDSFW